MFCCRVSLLMKTLCLLVLCSGEEFSDCKDLCECVFEERKTVVTCMKETIDQIPTNLPPNVTGLYLSGTSIKVLKRGAFAAYPNLVDLFFRDTESPCVIEKMKPGAFEGLNHLKNLGLIGCLRLLHVDRGVFGGFKVLDSIQLFRSGLTSVPDFRDFSTNSTPEGFMTEINLSNNRITEIKNGSFEGVKTNKLNLHGNRIKKIYNNAFKLAHVLQLSLDNNRHLTSIEEKAFQGIQDLTKLDLSQTSIRELPTSGISGIKELYLRETKSLRKFPSVLTFSQITRAELFYPHHCCAFSNPEKQHPAEWEEFQRQIQRECSQTTTEKNYQQVSGFPVLTLNDTKLYSLFAREKRNVYFNSSGFHDINQPSGFGKLINTSNFDGNEVVKIEGKFEPHSVPVNGTEKQNVVCGEVFMDYRKVECTPKPDAFNPCEDVMGYEWLRIFVWIVVTAAIFGNIIVLLVLLFSHGKLNVAKFLMCNLAFADFLMGIYLLLLASIDIRTLGEYFNFAISWQHEGGCQTAGFLTVFSSELSIFTLTVITMERWYAISHAIHLTKRLKLRQSVMLMTIGWLFAAALALMPLIGVSNYGNVSICLPMDVSQVSGTIYVTALLILNGLAFLVICACYINMYIRVRGNNSTMQNSDTRIAKRMATLVFTNFVCWAPIAFFGLTAAGGLPLIDISNSKILLVFFYPLNSCANPFLYVIITKQFRKDTYILLAKCGICKEKANRCKGTITNSRTLIHSRKDSLANPYTVHNTSETSLTYHAVDALNSGMKKCTYKSLQNSSVMAMGKLNGQIRRHSLSEFTTNDHQNDQESVFNVGNELLHPKLEVSVSLRNKSDNDSVHPRKDSDLKIITDVFKNLTLPVQDALERDLPGSSRQPYLKYICDDVDPKCPQKSAVFSDNNPLPSMNEATTNRDNAQDASTFEDSYRSLLGSPLGNVVKLESGSRNSSTSTLSEYDEMSIMYEVDCEKEKN